jgi:hypothetical protein
MALMRIAVHFFPSFLTLIEKKCRLVFYASIFTELCHVRILSVVDTGQGNGIVLGLLQKQALFAESAYSIFELRRLYSFGSGSNQFPAISKP